MVRLSWLQETQAITSLSNKKDYINEIWTKPNQSIGKIGSVAELGCSFMFQDARTESRVKQWYSSFSISIEGHLRAESSQTTVVKFGEHLCKHLRANEAFYQQYY